MKNVLAITALLVITAAIPALANDMRGDHMKGMSNHHFKDMDTNGDNYISKEEHRAFADKKFDKADTNHDGKLSMEEFAAFKKSEHAEWKGQMGGEDKSAPANDDAKTNGDEPVNGMDKSK